MERPVTTRDFRTRCHFFHTPPFDLFGPLDSTPPSIFRRPSRPWTLLLVVLLLLFGGGCDTFNGEEKESTDEIYPMFVDDDGNGVNDYVEASTHDATPSTLVHAASDSIPMGPAQPGHGFVDNNGDGICDYAQNGGATWHGPGFVDENENGICDYWDEESLRHHRHQGMRFQDQDDNQINDYFERGTHNGPAHDFVDANGDGICDRAQDGSPTWHGPNFVDEDGDGRCDYWEPGGRGHGHHGGGGGHHGGGR